MPIVQALRGYGGLRGLGLSDNRIGNVGCETLATLLRDPNCNLHTLDLGGNNILNDGTSILANGLANNTKLRELWLRGNQIDQRVADNFNKLLCNATSICHHIRPTIRLKK